jgi:hypothetical protein
VTNDQPVSDKAIGGNGGNGASGAHGFNGGNGGSGGAGNGGGLAVTLGINGYANEGKGQASVLRVNVANSKLLDDEAIGGKGGHGGNGLLPVVGLGGNASGGAVSLRGIHGDPTNLVILDTDFLFAGTAQGGAGGLGGIGIAVPGGQGGAGGAGFGGGLDVIFKGATHLLGTTILGNHAVGGKGGKGGSGLGGFGPTGPKGVSIGGGVRVATIPGATAAKDNNTLILTNSADIGPDVYGTLGTIGTWFRSGNRSAARPGPHAIYDSFAGSEQPASFCPLTPGIAIVLGGGRRSTVDPGHGEEPRKVNRTWPIDPLSGRTKPHFTTLHQAGVGPGVGCG